VRHLDGGELAQVGDQRHHQPVGAVGREGRVAEAVAGGEVQQTCVMFLCYCTGTEKSKLKVRKLPMFFVRTGTETGVPI